MIYQKHWVIHRREMRIREKIRSRHYVPVYLGLTCVLLILTVLMVFYYPYFIDEAEILKQPTDSSTASKVVQSAVHTLSPHATHTHTHILSLSLCQKS